MEYFGSVESIEQLKAEYLAYLRKWKGSAMMDEVKKQRERGSINYGKTDLCFLLLSAS